MNETIEPEPISPSSIEDEIDYTWPFGAKHKASRRIISAVLLVVLLSPIAWWCFAPDITAAAWHLRHGNSFDYEGVRFTIPRDRYVRCWAANACSVMPGIGYFRFVLQHPPAAYIMLNANVTGGADKLRQRKQMTANLMRWKLLGERNISMAGNEMQCLEYLQANQHFHSIMCFGSGTPIYATYMGDGDPGIFYDLLSTAQKQ